MISMRAGSFAREPNPADLGIEKTAADGNPCKPPLSAGRSDADVAQGLPEVGFTLHELVEIDRKRVEST